MAIKKSDLDSCLRASSDELRGGMDASQYKDSVSAHLIVHEVLNHWHESKQRILEERWLKALGWMREKGHVR